MNLPTKIASIIAAFGERKLTISEKKILLHWYQQLNHNSNPQLTKGQAGETEEKIFRRIQDHIEGKTKK